MGLQAGWPTTAAARTAAPVSAGRSGGRMPAPAPPTAALGLLPGFCPVSSGRPIATWVRVAFLDILRVRTASSIPSAHRTMASPSFCSAFLTRRHRYYHRAVPCGLFDWCGAARGPFIVLWSNASTARYFALIGALGAVSNMGLCPKWGFRSCQPRVESVGWIDGKGCESGAGRSALDIRMTLVCLR